jgi:anti-sigma B factor antagonist
MPRTLALADSIVGRADALPPAFRCWWANAGRDAAYLYLAGELDIARTPQLERELREPQSQARLVVLDLCGLTFIDNSGVHAIADAGTRIRQRGHRLLVLRGSPHIDRVFALTGSSADLVDVDIQRVEPSVEALTPVVAAEAASCALPPLCGESPTRSRSRTSPGSGWCA